MRRVIYEQARVEDRAAPNLFLRSSSATAAGADIRAGRRQRVYMSFVRAAAGGWHCRFHMDDLARTPISRRFVFRCQDKIAETARRGHGLTGLESRQALDEAVALGRGGIWLELDAAQLQTLNLQS